MNLATTGNRSRSRKFSRWARQAGAILQSMDRWTNESDEQLERHVRELAWEARGGKPLSRILTDVYSIVCETSRRTLGLVPYPVQIAAAIGLFEGNIIEMQTGEGKTLTATMPAILRALPGKGSHVVTANDYLASRDAEKMSAIYQQLGLTCGCVLDDMEDDDRRTAYDCDITYGTASQFGFDFLRDRLKRGTHCPYDDDDVESGVRRGSDEVQRGHYSVLVDEADSVLIDDAVTPLLIGLPQENPLSSLGLYHWCNETAATLEPTQDYIYEQEKRSAVLTEGGCRRILLAAKPASLDPVHIQKIYEHVETAISARIGMRKDTEYVIEDGEVVIVDESTGRKMAGRKWQRGLHQAVEAQEGLEISDQTVHAAQITVQSFFHHYEHLSGMTGTGTPAKKEFHKSYQLPVTPVPTHRPCRRQAMPPRIFRTTRNKWDAVVESITHMSRQGRAVLIGTPYINESEALSGLLTEQGISHQVLNARQTALEAEIISRAGRCGAVTIATNMAGRGTDVIIDEEVHAQGGLHVIATAMHSAARIDRQLIGRGARQGDPGSYQFFLSLEDPLLETLPQRTQRRCQRTSQSPGHAELPAARWLSVFLRAQRRLERLHAKQRRELLKAETQRKGSYRKMGLDPYIESPGNE